LESVSERGEPSRGIDIGAQADVHALHAQAAEQGVVVIMVVS
jgi:ABC-type sugar transport system ATPase subunit